MGEIPGDALRQVNAECVVYHTSQSLFVRDFVNSSFELACFRTIVADVLKPSEVFIILQPESEDISSWDTEVAVEAARFLSQSTNFRLSFRLERRVAASKVTTLHQILVNAGFAIESLDFKTRTPRPRRRKSE